MDKVISFILDTIPVGIISYDSQMKMVLCNVKARRVMSKYRLPDEIRTVTERIFQAISQSKLDETFPREIIFSRRLKGSPSKWTFYFQISSGKIPFVCIYILEGTISNNLDFDDLRRRFRLTRKENDILRRVLDGLKNIEIGHELGISEQTVKDHMSNIYPKIGVSKRFELLAYLMDAQKDMIAD